jgi:glycosyltransferase involved in cell wall biosynthesis
MAVTGIQLLPNRFAPGVVGGIFCEGEGCDGALAEESAQGEFLERPDKSISTLFQNATATLAGNNALKQEISETILPQNFSSLPLEAGALILQKYLNGLPENERYAAFASLVGRHWKWMCKAAPHLTFPEPKPVLEGQRVNLGIWVWRLTVDGIGRVMQLIANHYARDRTANVTLFISNDQAEKIDFTLHPNVTVVRIPSGRNGGKKWPQLMEEYPQDVIICPEHYLAENMQNILLLKFLGIRVIAQEHNFVLCRQPFTSLADKMAHLLPLYSCCDATTCLSRVDLCKWRGDGLGNVISLPNPSTFDPAQISPPTHQTKNVLWVGRWARWAKRPDLAIRIFAKVLEKVPDARLIMLGEHYNGRYHLECLRLVNELGISHAVEILGFTKHMAPHYASGAVLLSTSRIEGCPMVAIEAKAHGIPVVSSPMPWVEVLQAGCIQAPKGDADSMADALIDLLQNPEKRRRLGEEARRDIRENFSDDVIFARYDALIQAVLNGPSAVAKLCATESLMDSTAAEKILATAANIWK